MTTDEQIAALGERIDRLEADTLEPMQTSLLHLRSKFTPSSYLDTRYLPQLTGDVTHLAGTEPVDVPTTALDRFEFVNPVNGTGIGVAQVDQGDDTLILNVTETGRLVAIGVVVSKYTASGGTGDAYVRITIDGGTAQDFQIVFADRKWGKTTQPWVTVGATPTSGDVDGHALVLPMNLTYSTSLRVDLITNILTSFTGEYDLTATVLRGRLV